MTSSDFERVEQLFQQLLEELNAFSSDERREVHDFLDVAEYGLALETLVDIIDEERKPCSRRAAELVRELCEHMGLDIAQYNLGQ